MIGSSERGDRHDSSDAVTEADITIQSFLAYLPAHRYIFIPTRDIWPATSVNGRVPSPARPDGKKIKPSDWLDKNAAVEQMTWAPDLPTIIEDQLIDQGGWISHSGCKVFNLYREPNLELGDPGQATPWLDLVRKVYPRNAGHIIRWLAHRVQRPGEKVNHALVLGGKQGIGKDTILEPVKVAVGPWNFSEVSPLALLGRFNGFVKSVILRISEARDLGNVDRFAFYDHSKSLIAAPPDVLRCDEKNIREHAVVNVCGVIITTNHKSDGLYLPADDRRHYVAWSDLDKDDFSEDYWPNLWGWYERGGTEHVAAYLASLDLRDFNPKAPPPKTETFWQIVNASRAPEEAELADILDAFGNPDAITLKDLVGRAEITHPDFAAWLSDSKHRRQIPHRLESAGYEPVRNPHAKDGMFAFSSKRQVVYAKTELTLNQRLTAVERLGQRNQ